MWGWLEEIRGFLSELRRRNIYRVAGAYLAVAFVGFQAVKLLIPSTTLPPWADELILAFLIVGFPVSLVVAWAFEMTPEGMRRTPDAPSGEEPGETGVRAAYGAAVAIGLVAVAVAGGWYLVGGGGEAPEIDEGSVAVLPFEVSGSGTDSWHDGMVSILSTGLDGAAGLRAVADRTVLAAWRETGSGRNGATTGRALAVARKVGARYGVVGSAVRMGADLQLAAAVHETMSGERLGQAEVRGSPDSVTVLADELVRRVLGILLEGRRRDLPSAELANLTTRSVPALKAYLEGERHFRHGEFRAAVAAYRDAIRRDSTFASAHWRLARSYGWLPQFAGGEQQLRHRRRAYELAGQLPLRQRRLLQARLLLERGRHAAAVDSLRVLTDAYPDHGDAWYWLGEASLHFAIPPGWPGADEAFERAVTLDPGFAPYHVHLVDFAFSVHRDSALANDRIAAHPGLDGTEPWVRVLKRWMFREAAPGVPPAVRTDTVDTAVLDQVATPLRIPPERSDLMEHLSRKRLERGGTSKDLTRLVTDLVLTALYGRGGVRRALGYLRRPELGRTRRRCLIAAARSIGLLASDRPASGEQLRLPDPDSAASPREAACIGVDAAARGREEVARRASAVLSGMIREARDASAEGNDGAPAADSVDRFASLLAGYRAWKAGQPSLALGQLSRAAPLLSYHRNPVGLWMGDILRELGELERAEGWYLSQWHWSLAHERLGRLYEEMNRPKEAATAYRRFITAWRDADDPLRGRVTSARERLDSLTS